MSSSAKYAYHAPEPLWYTSQHLSSTDTMGGASPTSPNQIIKDDDLHDVGCCLSRCLRFVPPLKPSGSGCCLSVLRMHRLHAWYGKRQSASHHDCHECNACQFSYVSVLYCVCISSYFCVCVLVCSCTCKGTRNYVIHVIDSSSDDLHLRDMDQWFFFFPRPAACAAVWPVRDSKSWRISSRTCASSDGTS